MSSIVVFVHGPKADAFVPLFDQMMNTKEVPIGPNPYFTVTKTGDETRFDCNVSKATKTVPETDTFHTRVMPAEASYKQCMEKIKSKYNEEAARTVLVFLHYNDISPSTRLEMEKANPRQALILVKDNPTGMEIADYMKWDRVMDANDPKHFTQAVRDFAQDVKCIINQLHHD